MIKMYKLKPVFQEYFNQNKDNDLIWLNLNSNPCDGAVDMLEANPEKINGCWLSENTNVRALKLGKDKLGIHLLANNPCPYAMKLLIDKFHLIEWDGVSSNVSDQAMKLLENNQDCIFYNILCRNPNDKALDLIESNIDSISWSNLCLNTNDRAIKLLMKYPEKINWDFLSINKNDLALDLLESNIDKIFWKSLSMNPNKRALELMKTHPDKARYDNISLNTNIEVLEMFTDKINWKRVLFNKSCYHMLEKYPEHIHPDVFMYPGIFEVDLEWIAEYKRELHNELQSVVLHPDNYEYIIQHLKL